MTTPTVLGLDIGGANLKAATTAGSAASVPFALWKQPDQLPAVLATLVARLPDAAEIAITMTGEMCDCYTDRNSGVNAILDAVAAVAGGKPVRVWGMRNGFLSIGEARKRFLDVAAANWHATATFACRYTDTGEGLFLDIGSTTTDVIPITEGLPQGQAWTDQERLAGLMLVYRGVRRTPVFALVPEQTAAEFFATTEDVFVLLGDLPEDPAHRDTADGRPLTREFALARLARVLGTDRGRIAEAELLKFATRVAMRFTLEVRDAIRRNCLRRTEHMKTAIIGGAGEFLARRALRDTHLAFNRIVALSEELGPAVSACAPAYAVAVLAGERRS